MRSDSEHVGKYDIMFMPASIFEGHPMLLGVPFKYALKCKKIHGMRMLFQRVEDRDLMLSPGRLNHRDPTKPWSVCKEKFNVPAHESELIRSWTNSAILKAMLPREHYL